MDQSDHRDDLGQATPSDLSTSSGPPNAEMIDWPLRPWISAVVLAIAGAVVFLTVGEQSEAIAWRVSLAAFAGLGGLAFVLALERGEEARAALFAGVAGLVMAGIAWRAAAAGDGYSDQAYWVGAGILAIGLALPLYQGGFVRRRWATPYRAVHFHVWTDALSGAGALAFTGLSWLVLVLLANLFAAIEIDLLMDLLQEGLFGWMFSGAAFGGALGVLRNQRKVLATIQQVAMLVLSILALPLAAGLALFLVALLVSGPSVLWNATDSATPLLLACAAGCFVLANAILRDDDAEMTGNRVLRWAALALAALILPLTVFAAISMGVRIGQHGLSPERLWGLVAIAVATAYGLAYAVALVRGLRGTHWRDQLRAANLRLAAGSSVVALLLALPLLDFGAISTRDQIARLESGAVSVEEFDFHALKWDFGDAGRAALARLARGEGERAELAQAAQAQRSRWYRDSVAAETQRNFAGEWQVRPAGRELPAPLRELITHGGDGVCYGEAMCRVFLTDDSTAVVLRDECAAEGVSQRDQTDPLNACDIDMQAYVRRPDGWRRSDDVQGLDRSAGAPTTRREIRSALERERRAIDNGEIEVREVTRRQIFIGDRPIGEPFK